MFFRLLLKTITAIALGASIIAVGAMDTNSSTQNANSNQFEKPSTTVTPTSNEPDAAADDNSPDDDQAVKEGDKIDADTIEDTTPPGTGQKILNPSSTNIHQLFFHIQNAQCGQKIIIKLVNATTPSASNDMGTEENKETISTDLSFGKTVQVNEMADIDSQKDSITVSTPGCNQAMHESPVDDGVTQHKNTPGKYEVNAVVNVPANTTNISLNATLPDGVNLSVNRVGQDPQPIINGQSTTVSLQP